MKRVAVAVVSSAVLVSPGVAIQTAATASAEAQAAAWLGAHRNAPQQDELAELKDENPGAYALVKALLTKRSLGLLDPRHPSASFAAPPPQASQDDAPQGAAAFEKIAEESGEPHQVAPVYAEAPTGGHHDWLSWKPQQSAMDDEAMVKNVLGAVASLKAGGAPALRGSASSGNDDSSAGSLQWQEPAPAAAEAPPAVAAPAEQAPQVEAKPPASMSQENSYLKGIDFGGVLAPTAQAAPAQQENSYLKGLDLGSPDTHLEPPALAAAPVAPAAPKPAVGLSAVKKQNSTDYLSSFSFNDDAPAAPRAAPPAAAAAPSRPMEQEAAPAAASGSSKSSALSSWLGIKPVVSRAPAPKEAAPAQSSYMMDLA